MTTRDTETLAQLISARAGKRGSAEDGTGKLTFDDLSKLCIDEMTGYKPSGSHLWKIAQGEDVKISPKLIRAIAAGLGYPVERVQLAAARQYLGWQPVDPGIPGGSEDEVIRVATRGGVTPGDGGGVGDFVRGSREDYPSD